MNSINGNPIGHGANLRNKFIKVRAVWKTSNEAAVELWVEMGGSL
jgi:hypothetical protein